MLRLYNYYRSTASYRVRIALNIKGLNYELEDINLVSKMQHSEDYIKINPQQLVPTLEEDGNYFTQSLAIIEYLEEKHPLPPLLPQLPADRAKVRSLALTIACDIHPLNNLRVLNTLKKQFKALDDDISSWYHLWLKLGFEAIEKQLTSLPRNIDVCYGDSISIADICLVPQIYNAHRFGFSMQDYPLINSIEKYCLSLDSFKNAAP